MANTALGPLILKPVLVERIWGTDTLAPWYPQPAQGKPIGEVWLTAEQCCVEGTSSTLAEITAQAPEALGSKSGEGFPLLIKLLYPREKLSVQVHPDDAQAQATLNQPRGKTECWYVLSAEPGAQLAVGFREPMTSAEVRAAIEDGSVESRLNYLPVKAGDMVFVDAGTVHAIGPGMVVLETQQYSDVTYRLWDYGRPRELHLDAGMAVLRTQTAAGLVAPVAMDGFTRLVSSAAASRGQPANPHRPRRRRNAHAHRRLVPAPSGRGSRAACRRHRLHAPRRIGWRSHSHHALKACSGRRLRLASIASAFALV